MIGAKLSDFPPVIRRTAEPNWLCGPCGQTSESDALTCANFDAMLDLLDAEDPYGTTWEIVRFPHWGTGWLDLVFVVPGSPAQSLCDMGQLYLETHTALDEELWQEYLIEDTEEQLAANEETPTELVEIA